MKKKSFMYLSIGLSVLSAVLLGLLVFFIVRSNNYAIQLENNYKKAFYELASNIQSVELDLSKLVATNDIDTQRDILNDVYQITNTANGNLSSLPISNNKIKSVNHYLNTLGGYSFSLLTKVNEGSKLDSDDYANITWLHRNAVSANYDISEYINKIDNDYDILDDVKFGSADDSLWEGGLSNVNSANSQLPTLIYDGPFSDSVVNKKVRGISGDILTVEQAKEVLEHKFSVFDDYSIKYVGETNGKFATYNFELKSSNHKLYVQITKEGGFVLSISSLEVKDVKTQITIDQAQTLAINFATIMGFEDMQSVWSQSVGDVTYFNLAPVSNDVIYYPDLVKVKVDRGVAKVVGMDASNYGYNHTERPEYKQTITIDEGKSLISSALTIKQANKCVIPNEYVGESDAFEYVCEWEDYTYYIYLSTQDGKELNILRVIDTVNGNLLQ